MPSPFHKLIPVISLSDATFTPNPKKEEKRTILVNPSHNRLPILLIFLFCEVVIHLVPQHYNTHDCCC